MYTPFPTKNVKYPTILACLTFMAVLAAQLVAYQYSTQGAQSCSAGTTAAALIDAPDGAAVRALNGCERVTIAGAGSSAFSRAASGGSALPLVVEPASTNFCGDGSLVDFASENEDWVRAALDTHGALLFRGWSSSPSNESMTPGQCEQAVIALEPTLQGVPPTTYVAGASPRHGINTTLGHVATSTDMSAHFPIFMHLEMAYTPTPPKSVAFCALDIGDDLVAGETPIVDMAAVHDAVSPGIREYLEDHGGFRLTRNFKATTGKGAMAGYKRWMDVLQTDDKEVAAERCTASGATCSWREDGSMKMVTLLPVVAKHPTNGRNVWLNALHSHTSVPYLRASWRHAVRTMKAKTWAAYFLMSVTSMGFDMFLDYDAQIVHASFADDPLDKRLPGALMLDIIKVIEDEHVHFTWKNGDVLLLDNLRVAHGREPFSGDKRSLAAVLGPKVDIHGIMGSKAV